MAEMSDLDWEALHENFDTAELLTFLFFLGSRRSGAIS